TFYFQDFAIDGSITKALRKSENLSGFPTPLEPRESTSGERPLHLSSPHPQNAYCEGIIVKSGIASQSSGFPS
ncbi:MAG: hypothetical protein AAGC43_18255, partial [Bacteroidota bacterium]